MGLAPPPDTDICIGRLEEDRRAATRGTRGRGGAPPSRRPRCHSPSPRRRSASAPPRTAARSARRRLHVAVGRRLRSTSLHLEGTARSHLVGSVEGVRGRPGHGTTEVTERWPPLRQDLGWPSSGRLSAPNRASSRRSGGSSRHGVTPADDPPTSATRGSRTARAEPNKHPRPILEPRHTLRRTAACPTRGSRALGGAPPSRRPRCR